MTDRFLIAPLTTGLETDLKPFLIPDDAFQQLNNAYVFRGRVRKRFGTRPSAADGTALHSRLAVQVGVITSGALSGTVPGAVFQIGQMFSVLNQLFTVITSGATQTMLSTGPGTGTFSTTNGAFAITGTGAANSTPVFFYPSTPVMGIVVYEKGAINTQPTIIFDTQFAYYYNGTQWVCFGPSASPFATFFEGGDQFPVWDTTWTAATDNIQALFVTNFNASVPTPAATDDPMYYFTGLVPGGTWTEFAPVFSVSATGTQPAKIVSCRIISVFKNRLVLLDTIEQSADASTNYAYVNRCRYSQNGSPTITAAFYQANQTGYIGGGFIDAPTQESIISAEFIKDRFIVYFERSTWELAYTQNESQPFIWQKINTELGSEATFSSVPFDKFILTVGNTGIHECNGANVQRIDNKIPDSVFDIVDKSTGVTQVAGIRDYFNEMVYWTFPSDTQNAFMSFPNRLLVYNYKNGSWAFFDDCITAFGYYFGAYSTGQTWAQSLTTWSQSDFPWNAGAIQGNARQILAGTPQGFIMSVFSEGDDTGISRNSPSMQITALANTGDGTTVTMTAINHNLSVGDFVLIENCQGAINLNNVIYQVQSLTDSNIFVAQYVGSDLTVPTQLVGSYTGGGTLARVSQINIWTKQWNPYLDKGRNLYLSKIDFNVEATPQMQPGQLTGQITVDYYTNSSTGISLVNAGTATGSIMGSNILETYPYPNVPYEAVQDRLWHRIYFQADGDCVQLNIYHNNAQMSSYGIATCDFEIDAMILHTDPTSARIF